MKKIVSVLSVAALSFSIAFAADISLEYRTRGTLYSESNTKDYSTDKVTQTRTALDQSGYGDASTDFVISAKNDFSGFVLDIDPNASTKSDFVTNGALNDWFDQYYAWLNFANLQVTVGKWSSRYGNELTADSGNWEDDDFARYHVGVVNGKFGHDVDNLTGVTTWTAKTNGAKSTQDGDVYTGDVTLEQRIGTALAYTVRPNDDVYFMLKGVLVESDWGSTLRLDSDRDYSSAYSKTDGNGGDLTFHSGFATEAALHVNDAIDINLVAKSLKRDELALGLFVRPILGDTNLLFGVTYGTDLADKDTDGDGEDNYDSNYWELGVDFRARIKLSDALALTTMHNLSIYNEAVAKKQDYNGSFYHLWNMVSLAYKADEQLLLQLTLENEADVLETYANDKRDGNSTSNVADLGGFNISIVPGVTYSFNENATLTAGLRWEFDHIGASSDWEDAQGSTGVKTSSFSIPVVFKVSL